MSRSSSSYGLGGFNPGSRAIQRLNRVDHDLTEPASRNVPAAVKAKRRKRNRAARRARRTNR